MGMAYPNCALSCSEPVSPPAIRLAKPLSLPLQSNCPADSHADPAHARIVPAFSALPDRDRGRALLVWCLADGHVLLGRRRAHLAALQHLLHDAGPRLGRRIAQSGRLE